MQPASSLLYIYSAPGNFMCWDCRVTKAHGLRLFFNSPSAFQEVKRREIHLCGLVNADAAAGRKFVNGVLDAKRVAVTWELTRTLDFGHTTLTQVVSSTPYAATTLWGAARLLLLRTTWPLDLRCTGQRAERKRSQGGTLNMLRRPSPGTGTGSRDPRQAPPSAPWDTTAPDRSEPRRTCA